MKPSAFAGVVALALPLLAVLPARAQAVSTEEFVNKAAMSDMFEIESGQLAADKAQNEDVQEFAEQMVNDHSETSDALKELIKEEDIKAELPTTLDQEHKAKLNKLKNASDAEFDKVYIPMQVLAHEKAVNMFGDYAKSGDNEALKEWAADTLPTLEEHLEEARSLNMEISKPAETAEADTPKKKAKPAETSAEADDNKDINGTKTAGDIEYVTRQKPSDWSAQALIGRTVENTEGENLGEINNVIINEKGQVVAVTIGVGGFLGLGEKDVGVPFNALKFRVAKENDQGQSDTATDETNTRFDTEHSEMEIVLNATRDQLENAPEFLWLDEQDDKRETNAD